MDNSTRAPRYDLFKLVVAILLLLLFICLLLWIPTNVPPDETPTSTLLPLTETQPVTETLSPPIPSPTETSDSSTPTSLPLPSPSFTSTNDSLTPTVFPLPSPTDTPVGTTATSVAIPSPTGTATPVLITTATPTLQPTIPSSTPTLVTEPSSTPTAGPTPITYTCESALSRSRLQVGGNATIFRRLNFRSSPGIQNNWLRTNLPGTQVEVLDGPVCLPYSRGAYVWWQIKLPDGQVGWSAEISLLGRFYFMEPRP